jgi:endoglucanase
VLAAGAVACRARRTASPADRARAASQAFLGAYLDAGGRVVRRDQGGDTVSEGQAYAMLVAAATGDRQRFDLAWQ